MTSGQAAAISAWAGWPGADRLAREQVGVDDRDAPRARTAAPPWTFPSRFRP